MGLKPPNDTQLLARTVLLCNVEVELVQLLLQNNYNPNYPQNCRDVISVTIDGRMTSVDMSPLHLAMYQGQKNVTELLLKYGAEVNRRTKLGKTALHMASMFGHTDVLELLLRHGCDIDAVDCGNNTALGYAINGQHPSTTKLLLEGGASLENINDNDASFLDMALFFNQSEIIYYLLKCGYDCNQHFQTGESFAYYGSHYTNSILFSLILNNDAQNVRLLINCGYKKHIKEFNSIINSLPMIEHSHQSSFPKSSLKCYLSHAICNPQSLLDSARISVRDTLNLKRVECFCSLVILIDKLPLPDQLKGFLYFDH